MEKKKFKLGLVPKLIIAIIVGILFGQFLPEGAICAIMVALYITQDSFGTACNISGDNAIGIIVDTIYKKFILKTPQPQEN